MCKLVEFMPTYKFKEGKTEYIFDNPKKQPSYTDRVIFRCLKDNRPDKNSVIVERYDSQKIFLSDHIPLFFTARLLQ